MNERVRLPPEYRIILVGALLLCVMAFPLMLVGNAKWKEWHRPYVPQVTKDIGSQQVIVKIKRHAKYWPKEAEDLDRTNEHPRRRDTITLAYISPESDDASDELAAAVTQAKSLCDDWSSRPTLGALHRKARRMLD